jgi:hypothetical protein
MMKLEMLSISTASIGSEWRKRTKQRRPTQAVIEIDSTKATTLALSELPAAVGSVGAGKETPS